MRSLSVAKPLGRPAVPAAVEETVDCQECGLRYDSSQNAFCPRCGSEHKAPERRATMDLVKRSDPARRRVQIGGVILMALAALALIQFLIAAFDTSPPDDATLEMLSGVELMRDTPGGDLDVLGNGTYVLRLMDGTEVENGTLAGSHTFDLSSTFTNLTLTTGDGEIIRLIYLPEGESHTLDLQGAAPGQEWVAAGTVGAMQALAGFMAFFAALTVLGGLMAFRLRHRKVAYLACGLALLPGLVLLILLPAAGLLLLLLPGAATGLIVSGRQQFQ